MIKIKKHIVIIATDYPPSKGVASYRIQALAKSFVKKNYEVTIFCKYTSGEDISWEHKIASTNKRKVVKDSGVTIYYLPMINKSNTSSIMGKVNTFYQFTKGVFQPELEFYAIYGGN